MAIPASRLQKSSEAVSMQKLLLAVLVSAFGVTGASAQQQAAQPTSASTTTGDLLGQGYEIKGVINNTYLLMQKGDRAFLCGSAENLTWANWAEHTRDAA